MLKAALSAAAVCHCISAARHLCDIHPKSTPSTCPSGPAAGETRSRDGHEQNRFSRPLNVEECLSVEFMTNVVTSVHADAHGMELNEQRRQRVDYTYHSEYIRPLPLLLIWFQAEKH